MNLIIILLSCLFSIIPIILIGYNFYVKDTIKEPKKLLNKLFIFGILSGIIVIIISIYELFLFPSFTNVNKIDNFITLFIYSFIFIALTEEICKFFIIYILGYNNKEFDQAYDIILYSVFVALGFAFFENVIYIINNPNIQVLFLRIITALPAHIFFQTIMGYYLYLSKLNNRDKCIFLSIFIPTVLHGCYDFLVFTGSNVFVMMALGLLIIMFIITNSKIKQLINVDKNNLKKQ